MVSGNDVDGVAAAAPHAPNRRRWLAWLVVLVIVVLLAWLVTSMQGGGSSSADNRVDRPGATASASNRDGMSATRPENDRAVILSARTDEEAMPAVSATVTPGTASSVPNEAVKSLVASVNNKRPARHSAVRHRRRSRSEDGDVTLLAALISHVSNTDSDRWQKAASVAPKVDPAVEAMKDCPAANTAAGVKCRQRICEKLQGLSSSCPKPVAADDH